MHIAANNYNLLMKYLYLFLCLIITSHGWAQKQNVYFFKNDGSRVDVKDSADYIRVLREPDAGSALYNVLDFYPKGQKKLIGKSSKIDPVVLEGTCLAYYDNGQKQRVANYKKGVTIGPEYSFFPNGQLYTVKEFSIPDSADIIQVRPAQIVLIKTCNDSAGKALVINGNGHYIGYRDNFKEIAEEGEVKDGKSTGEWKGMDENGKLLFTETYDNNQLITGKATDTNGSYTYHERYIYPRYKGGVAAFYQYLGRNIHYPEADRRDGTQGIVILSFIVTKTGKIEHIKQLTKVSPTIDEEAIRVLRESKNWMSGAAYGRQVDCQFTVPISFALSN